MPVFNKEKTMQREIDKLRDQLLHLAIATNNVILQGSYTGDIIFSASELMTICLTISEEHNERNKA